MASDSALSVGLVHDYLLVMRGAERTFAAMADCWPDATVYASLFEAEGTEGRFAGRRVRTSYLQMLHPGQAGFRRLLPLYPSAVARLPVGEHGLVVSSSSAFAHGVRPRPGAIHVCYCHSPFRYAWHERDIAIAEVPAAARPVVRHVLERIRRWDVAASARVSKYLAGSHLVKDRIERFYGREATVVHPPVETDRFAIGEAPEDFFLVVCELVRHKRVGNALEAARRAGRPIKVVGTGPELARLEAEHGSSAEFLRRISDAELTGLYARARALVVPGVEEFGIAAVEVQAAGRPVIAVDAGGTRETVIDGETGVLVREGSVEELAEAMREVDFDRFSSPRIAANAERFSRQRFQRRLREEVDGALEGGGDGGA